VNLREKQTIRVPQATPKKCDETKGRNLVTTKKRDMRQRKEKGNLCQKERSKSHLETLGDSCIKIHRKNFGDQRFFCGNAGGEGKSKEGSLCQLGAKVSNGKEVGRGKNKWTALIERICQNSSQRGRGHRGEGTLGAADYTEGSSGGGRFSLARGERDFRMEKKGPNERDVVGIFKDAKKALWREVFAKFFVY